MELLDLFGVYLVKNRITETIYIGSTAHRFRDRKKDHWAKLRLGRHKNSRLQRAWNKYGEDAFEFLPLEVVSDTDQVLAREQFYLDQHFGKNCYNARRIAESNRGWQPTAETRQRMSRACKGHRRLTEQSRRAISEKTKGLVRNPWTTESREKLAAKKRGVPRAPEVAAKIAEANRRRCQDPAYVAKITCQLNDPANRRKSIEAIQKRYSGVFVSPDGREYAGVVNLTRFCAEHGLSIPPMSEVSRGIRQRYKGWTYRAG